MWAPWIAALVFALLAATDGVDGYLARSRNEVTTFGKFLDPLADKLLVTAALLALVEMHVLPAWIALVIISREFIVSGPRMVAVGRGNGHRGLVVRQDQDRCSRSPRSCCSS